jgi:cytoskeletal protein CcmA (bactofilin family)
MFTRNSPAAPRHESGSVAKGANGAVSAAGPETNEKSVIGNDLKIIGQGLKIIGRGVLQVDDEIEGDVQAAEVIVGEKGQVTGMVAGRQVVVRGKVSGIVCGRTVALQASSKGRWRHPPHVVAHRAGRKL